MLSENTLKEIIRRIVEVARPEKIILFGSAARGEMGPNSDVDLLVVKSGAHRRKLAIELIDLWKAFKNSVLRRSSSDLYAAAKVAYYREFLTDGVLLEDVFEPVEDDVFYAYRAKLGDGRWIGVDLDRLFTEMIRRKTDGRDDAVKLTLDRYGDIDVKALDCGTCPFVRDPYSCHLLHDKELCKGENRALHDERRGRFMELAGGEERP